RIPAVQSISAELQQLREHNDNIRARRRARVLLTRHNQPEAIDGLAETLFATYRAQRIADAIDYVVLEISRGLVLKGNYGLGRRGRREWLRQTIADLQLPWVPNHPPYSPDASAEQSIAHWRWGTRPVEHLARLLLDIVIRTERVATLLSRPAGLADLWEAAYDILEKIERVRGRDREYGRSRAEAVLDLLGDGKPKVYDEQRERRASDWMKGAVDGWQATASREAAQLLHEIAGHLLSMWQKVSTFSAAAAGST